MERPKRSAAERARKLIADGYCVGLAEEIDDDCLSEDEEDRLDEDLLRDDHWELNEDEEEETARRPGGTTAGKTYPSYNTPDVEVPPMAFTPRRRPGLHVPTSMNTRSLNRPIDFFRLFFSDDIVETICDNTNTYAWVHILQRQSYSKQDGSWDAVSMEEMHTFLGLVIFMGFYQLPDIHRYWSNAPLYLGGWARRFLSRNRFKALLAFLHVADPGKEVPTDKMTKLQPLLSHMKAKCKEFLQPQASIAIDERMVKSKGRSGIRQYMPAKPVRFGFKLWCLADSHTGYTVDFNIYTGKCENAGPHGLAFDVVVRLMADYMHQGYALYIDNYYTSVPLVQHMAKNDVGVCGTMNRTRRGFPKVLKDPKWARKARRGEMRYVRADEMVFIQWMDSKIVNMVSTLHMGNSFTMVKRNLRDPTGAHRPVMVRKPLAIVDYNRQMGGVDLSDQLLQPYSVLIKSYRWWRTLFFHFLDVAIVNSHILYKEWFRTHGDSSDQLSGACMSQLTFREQLVKQLAGIRDDEDLPTPPSVSHSKEHARFHTSHVPAHTLRRLNCRLCYILYGMERRSRWMCVSEDCNLPLCMNSERNCFAEWHSPDFDDRRDKVLKYKRAVS